MFITVQEENDCLEQLLGLWDIRSRSSYEIYIWELIRIKVREFLDSAFKRNLGSYHLPQLLRVSPGPE